MATFSTLPPGKLTPGQHCRHMSWTCNLLPHVCCQRQDWGLRTSLQDEMQTSTARRPKVDFLWFSVSSRLKFTQDDMLQCTQAYSWDPTDCAAEITIQVRFKTNRGHTLMNMFKCSVALGYHSTSHRRVMPVSVEFGKLQEKIGFKALLGTCTDTQWELAFVSGRSVSPSAAWKCATNLFKYAK